MTIRTPDGLAQLLARLLAHKRDVRTARRELNPVQIGVGDLIRAAYEYAGGPDAQALSSYHGRVVEQDIAKIEEYLGMIEGRIDRLRNQASLAAQAVETADAKRRVSGVRLKI
jgi:hypothetical protein